MPAYYALSDRLFCGHPTITMTTMRWCARLVRPRRPTPRRGVPPTRDALAADRGRRRAVQRRRRDRAARAAAARVARCAARRGRGEPPPPRPAVRRARRGGGHRRAIPRRPVPMDAARRVPRVRATIGRGRRRRQGVRALTHTRQPPSRTPTPVCPARACPPPRTRTPNPKPGAPIVRCHRRGDGYLGRTRARTLTPGDPMLRIGRRRRRRRCARVRARPRRRCARALRTSCTTS